MHRVDRRFAAVLGLGLLACSESTTSPPARARAIPLPGLTVSESVSEQAGTRDRGSGAAVVYVSLPPGTLADVSSVQIRNLSRSGSAALVIPVVDGGFDPVAVLGGEGDELELEFTHDDGHASLEYLTVPFRRPPTIVRTSPPRGRVDVALNVRPAVIFSEPIDPRSLTPSTIQFETAEGSIDHQIIVRPELPFAAEIVPKAELDPATTYWLVIQPGVRDLQGDSLGLRIVVEFTTEVPQTPAAVDQIAFVSTRSGQPFIYVARGDGSGVTRLAAGEAPAWSRDGHRIAFHRGAGKEGASGIYVMNADGSNQRFLRYGHNPSWSPDGSILFHTDLWQTADETSGIMVMDDQGRNARILLSHAWAKAFNFFPGYGTDAVSMAAASPDGRRIAFWLYAGYGGTHSVGIMNADGSEPHDLQAHQPLQYSTWGRPAWSPNGTRIVSSNGFFLGVYDVATGGRVAQVAFDTYAGDPDWSPDGLHVVFSRGWFGSPVQRIWIVNVETGAMRQLIPEAVLPRLADYADYGSAWYRPPGG